MASSFYIFNDTTGLVTPDTSTLLTDVQTEYQTAFGANLTLQPNTPQGILISAETLARNQVLQIICEISNQINPDYAGGIALDSILALTNPGGRTLADFTVVSCNLTGVTGTIIPAGSMAQDTNGNLYASQNTVTLVFNGTTGAATVNMIAVASGAIAVSPNALNIIVSNILGWETITNPTIQTSIGSTIQTDAQARAFRRNTLAVQGQGTAQAIISNGYALPNVTSLFYRQNDFGTAMDIDGVTLAPHSLYLCITGGSNQAVANILDIKKNAGCGYNNAVLTTQTATLISGSPNITGLSSTTGMFIGQYIAGTGIPTGATILTVNSGTSVTLTENATVTGSESITFYLGIPQSFFVTDPYSGQVLNILFDNPFLIPIAVRVTAQSSTTLQNVVSLIQTAIINYATGQIAGDPGLGIGVDVSCFELAGAINITAPSIYITNVEISLASSISYSNASISIAPYQQASISLSNITVVLV